jgi:hypothetical protein
VVTQQWDHPAAIFCRLLFQGHEQIHDVAWLGAAVQEIAHLYESGLTPSPVVLLINEVGVLKNGNKVLKITVHITDSDQWGDQLSLGRSSACPVEGKEYY